MKFRHKNQICLSRVSEHPQKTREEKDSYIDTKERREREKSCICFMSSCLLIYHCRQTLAEESSFIYWDGFMLVFVHVINRFLVCLLILYFSYKSPFNLSEKISFLFGFSIVLDLCHWDLFPSAVNCFCVFFITSCFYLYLFEFKIQFGISN